jgi:hypothetical protein
MSRQIEALGTELADLLDAELSMPTDAVTGANVDISIPDPIRTTATVPTVVEHGLTTTGLGVAVGAVVGTITLNPVAGWAAFAERSACSPAYAPDGIESPTPGRTPPDSSTTSSPGYGRKCPPRSCKSCRRSSRTSRPPSIVN